MRGTRCLTGAIVAALGVTMIAGVGTASAQVAELVEQLGDGSDTLGVAEARKKLVNLLSDTSVPAQQQRRLAEEAMAALGGALNAESLMVRINAVLVLHEATVPGAIDLLVASLVDQHEAIRLLSAKGLANLARRVEERQLTEANGSWQDKQKLMVDTLLGRLANHEKSNRVVQEIFAALAEVRIPSADMTILKGLIVRSTRRMGRLDAPTWGEQRALEAVCTSIVKRHTNRRNPVPEEERKKLAEAIYRYFKICTVAVASDEVDEGLRDRYHQIAQLAHNYLRWSAQKFNVQELPQLPGLLSPNILLEFEAQWRALLSRPPIAISPEALRLEPPKRNDNDQRHNSQPDEADRTAFRR